MPSRDARRQATRDAREYLPLLPRDRRLYDDIPYFTRRKMAMIYAHLPIGV